MHVYVYVRPSCNVLLVDGAIGSALLFLTLATIPSVSEQ